MRHVWFTTKQLGLVVFDLVDIVAIWPPSCCLLCVLFVVLFVGRIVLWCRLGLRIVG